MNNVLYEGKSKIVCQGTDVNNCVIRFKDTTTAFNGEKKEELSGKGRLNTEISKIIFDYLGANGIKTHLIKVMDEITFLVKKAEIILVEVIVRNVAAGSFAQKYGVAEGMELNNTIVEFSYKNDFLGDPMINETQIMAIGLATKAELAEMTEQALKINELLGGLFAKAGIRLADFKLEFGRCGGGIILCDEISPDACRLWDINTNEKLDKDRFRRDLGNVLDGYKEVLRRLKNVRQI